MTVRFEHVAVTLALASWTASLSIASCSPEFQPRPGEDAGTSGAGDGSAGAQGESGASTGSNGSAGDSSSGGGDGHSVAGAGGAGDEGAGSAGTESTGDDGGSGGEASGIDAGEGGEGGASNVCDPTKSPAVEVCVIDEAYGVFVAPNGSDETGVGSREEPFATLERGIAEAIASDRRLYACADRGAYAESLHLDAAASGIEMFGGFSCVDWSYDVARKSVVGSTAATALHVSGLEGLHAEDFEFEGGAGTTPGESSIAVWLDRSIGVELVRSVIRAGKGADGADGVLSPFEYPLASNLRGNSATGGDEGLAAGEKRCECQTAARYTVGGGGGWPENLSGTAGLPDHGGGEPGPTGGSACVKKEGEDTVIGVGSNGGDAPAAPWGAGALTAGLVDSTGWQPGNGESGATGGPGQGGGGGASLGVVPVRGIVSRGGGGGCGGCGGNGGAGGRGGGASIALLVVDSEVTLSESVLVAGGAGAGGAGSAGQEGQLGGSAGAGVDGCRGGRGGTGGRGGAGGGGAGGISAGAVWIGTASPIFDASYVLKGDPGAAGIGGEPGVNDGIPGVAREVLEAN